MTNKQAEGSAGCLLNLSYFSPILYKNLYSGYVVVKRYSLFLCYKSLIHNTSTSRFLHRKNRIEIRSEDGEASITRIENEYLQKNQQKSKIIFDLPTLIRIFAIYRHTGHKE